MPSGWLTWLQKGSNNRCACAFVSTRRYSTGLTGADRKISLKMSGILLLIQHQIQCTLSWWVIAHSFSGCVSLSFCLSVLPSLIAVFGLQFTICIVSHSAVSFTPFAVFCCCTTADNSGWIELCRLIVIMESNVSIGERKRERGNRPATLGRGSHSRRCSQSKKQRKRIAKDWFEFGLVLPVSEWVCVCMLEPSG